MWAEHSGGHSYSVPALPTAVMRESLVPAAGKGGHPRRNDKICGAMGGAMGGYGGVAGGMQ